MPISYLEYDLKNGYIQHWLTAGPQAIPIKDLEGISSDDFKQRIIHSYYEKKPGITHMPVERGPLTEGLFNIGSYEGSWTYTHCGEDHFIDQSIILDSCHYLRSWAYTRLVNNAPGNASFTLTSCGPADVWIGGKHIHRQEHFSATPISVPFTAPLKEGTNEIVVRFETVSVGVHPLAIALQVNQPESQLKLQIPTLIKSIERRSQLEQTFEAVYLEREVFAGDEQIRLHWPEDTGVSAYTLVRFKNLAGQIYAEAEVNGVPGDSLFLGISEQNAPGPYVAHLMPLAWEFYEQDLRITKDLSLWCLGNARFSETPYGTYEERRQEAFAYAARNEGSLHAEIAKMALGRWNMIESPVLLKAIDTINQRKNGADLILVSLIGMIQRYGSHPQFPRPIKKALKECILAFKYWEDEPGNDVMDFPSNQHRINFYTAEILAGQIYTDLTFSNNGQNGRWHRQEGEQRALAWLREVGETGFQEWDSPDDFSAILAAVSHLAELSHTSEIWEMASVVMDKLFFSIALNSYKGIFGSTHARTRTAALMGGRLEATSGITRLMWGQGIYNSNLAGVISLACMKKYDFTPILAEIATSLPEEQWNLECHGSEEKKVNKVTYKTPDGMLCSAQSYLPGKQNGQEHIWQATLGPEAVVFVNHPACSSEADVHQPAYWAGNGVLPRVAQWKDCLIALYNLPEDDWMGFTHAYFPTFAYDETILRDGWAFARKVSGYIALTASHSLTQVKQGKHAYRELRCVGKQTAWVCLLGRETLDGDFASFQEKVLGLKKSVDGLTVQIDTLRGESLLFNWEGPFTKNGEELPLDGFPHYQNPYTQTTFPCKEMQIKTDNYLLRLDFGDVSQ